MVWTTFASMPTFHDIQVQSVHRETAESVVVALDIPEALRADFLFEAGQYLTLRTSIDGEDIRRSYSLCSSPGEGAWQVGIKKVPGGKFSTHANDVLKAGDTLQVMDPQGRFVLVEGAGKHHVGFAAGSGITPILSQIKDVLSTDPTSSYTLFYANKTAASTMFREAIQDLKDRHLDRLRVFYLLTREPVDATLLSGRLDQARCADLMKEFCSGASVDAAYLCGPESMIMGCKEALRTFGLTEDQIRFELFTSAGAAKPEAPRAEAATGDGVLMQIVLDGVTTSVSLDKDKNMLDAALDAGLDAPYSCLGGVCCTCRAKLVKGKATMNVNFALEPSEVERGYVLACQAHVAADEDVVLDFDQQ
jgi:ring-1,2-phenylacetyl-CoA epoxidase subunit PaaE